MMWIVVSLPLWFVGLFLLAAGIYGIGKAAANDSDIPAFKSGDDGDVIIVGLCLVLFSSPLLYVAAKLVAS